MSRSETYRPAYLTAAQREELACQARAQRSSELLTALREHVRLQTEGLVAQGSLPSNQTSLIEQQLGCATDAATLRVLSTNLAASSLAAAPAAAGTPAVSE